MPELDDKTTDELFQVGAGRHDFEYEPAAWEQMETLLERDDRLRRWRWIGGILLAAALLVGSFAYFGGARDLPEEIPAGSIVANPPATNNKSSAPSRKTPVAEAEGQTVRPDNQNVANAATSPRFSADRPANDITRRVSVKAETSLAATVETLSRQPLPEDNVAPTSDEASADIEPAPVTATGLTPAVAQLAAQPVTALDYTSELPGVDISLPARVIVPAGTYRPGFAATVSAGYASGMVEAGDFGPADQRFGFKLDYRLTNKISVGTGAAYSNVCYRVDGDVYKAADNFFPEAAPKDVTSDCDILEIPLAVTWHPHGSDRSGFYASGGLTSYFMLIEKFNFLYDEEVTDLSPKTWREDDTNRHLFGAGQFSLGYQRKAGRRSAFQLETFVQLPLTGIGQGQVNLMTVGASVNYTFDFRKRR